ncbi:hypothetical protein LINPERPRIM_LOCUS15279 [Linum perenne]
MLSWELAFQIW